MSIHAADKNMHVENLIIDYRDRPQGSQSKLNTYSDGMKVLYTIVKLYKTYKPLAFFGGLSFVLGVISAILFIPIFTTYLKIGTVPRFPTLFVSGFIMLAAIQSFFAGMILQTINQKNKQDFEMELHRINDQLKKLRTER